MYVYEGIILSIGFSDSYLTVFLGFILLYILFIVIKKLEYFSFLLFCNYRSLVKLNLIIE